MSTDNIKNRSSWQDEVKRVATGIRRRVLEHTITHNGRYLSQACSSAEIFAALYAKVMTLGKIDPQLVPGLPEPRPMFEIFVYSPRVEGVHLRGGKVARGGLRWSDRMEDFRTEVLGLVKAQMVKNAVSMTAVVTACRERGLLINCTQGNILRFLPPLIVSKEEIDRSLEILAAALEAVFP